jgi:uncharacterized protein YcnI/copper(I)-binding protein
MSRKLSALFALAITAMSLLCLEASAHVSIDNAETKGGTFKARFNVPHGCEGSATTAVKITIPEGIIGVKPMPKPGWTLATTKAAYAKTYDYFHGMKVSEGVKTVSWSGGTLLNEHIDEFTLSMFVTKSFAPGTKVYFPVEQVCEKGSHAWNEIPAEGQDAHDLKSPAPAIKILAQVSNAASAQTPSNDRTFQVGSLKISNPWTRATPGGATVAAGYVTIANTGTDTDRLIGGSFPVSARVEVHDMTMTDGVMKMRELADGLEIKPGATVTLAPGGLHLMMMDLKQPVEVGAPIKAQLKFEKAGPVDVEFTVSPIGSQSSQRSDKHDHH